MDRKLLQRVDVQVAILVVAIVAFCSMMVYYLVYSMTYNELIRVLHNQSDSIAGHIDENLNTDIFHEIKTEEDMTGDAYREAYEFLNEVRAVSNAKYLYTAAMNDNGELIYHVDGLPYDDADFRNVGDLIEPEFQEPLFTAFENVVVTPDDILHTEWGDVYVAYYPIHGSDGDVVAALGIEFPADSQYRAYQNIRWTVNVFIVLICFIAGYVAHALFKRISNPHFRDMYNTDSLTKLKNRNAFDTDAHNNIEKHNLNGVIVVATDLNNLKKVNDQMGHKMGDFYIKSCALALGVDNMDYCIVYRIGGDEFMTLIPTRYGDRVEHYITAVKENLIALCGEHIPFASASMGYAVCEGTDLEAWEKAQRQADRAMYTDKKAFYEQNKELDGRR